MIEQQEYDRILKYMKDIEFALDVSSIVAIADRTGKITYANDKFCEISQYPRSELIGKDHNIVNSNYHPKEFFKEMWKTIGSGKVWKGEIKNKTKNGNYYWVDTTIVPFLDENGKVYQYVSIRNDITKQKEMSERIEYAAYHDSITGLPNKRYLDEQLEKEIEKHYTEKSHFALMFLDLDNFKLVNDTLGHHEGDLFLKELANQLISANIRDSFIARRSGDEFIIIVRNVKEQKEIVQVAKKVLSIFNTGFAKNKTYKNITGSIGVSVFPCNANNSQKLMQKADIAMYHAKSKGKNCLTFYEKDMDLQTKKFFSISENMRQDLYTDKFSLHYQPQFDALTKELVGIEALLRWEDKDGNNIPPSVFIPIAEESDLIVDLGIWVLRKATFQNVEWQHKGYPKVPISVNVSVKQINNQDFIVKLKEILYESRLEPKYLNLEITETFMYEKENAMNFINEIKNLGISIAIDDFGTGYSSLQYLIDMPMDVLKIDRAFVKEIESNPTKMGLLKGILSIAQTLNIKTVAEGVELEKQYDLLKENGCNIIQGYYFSKPKSKDEIESLIFSK
ncbi:hypothetical protein BC6307_04085 [Sutcliffiella cohnii]|uniref:GGDEF domain-containing protein n=1 Tax=Sutcliffiella cohnii TaxID=33932 RepID=A0A223KMG7_9BACI|nr:EAL domain-containing protein [Sutcliffiella cohnii]AST90513.1 hypothetical protein BC6307_04085 [Sutcliffiella cohnii]